MRWAISIACICEAAIPNSGAIRFTDSRTSPNAPRSSAKLIASGLVPRIVTPAALSPAAKPSGVCPPNWVMTPRTGPASVSAWMTSSTSSRVRGSK